jgi:hypothetical protein
MASTTEAASWGVGDAHALTLAVKESDRVGIGWLKAGPQLDDGQSILAHAPPHRRKNWRKHMLRKLFVVASRAWLFTWLSVAVLLMAACGSLTATSTATRATSGSLTEFPLPQSGIPRVITTAPDGALWFSENGKIGRIEP